MVTIAYETYNTVAVLSLPEYCNAAFIGHHSTCLLLALASMHPFLHYCTHAAARARDSQHASTG